ncbi:hypothetical protein A2V71_03130 [Candidatus Berkelbacteria bacterium RBG_13_40_8]|uniref:Glycosyltransferase RgtA/B/C/D-like domain-containing protein n=1 Tax=Candidatus Berkelbacteria bacterium RBG_13_40_8 TaxID=1797467 RepID=A0A1F5DPH8_9BACT|nr:MAG: hypothetical protein A2V71_03130 [Candidatus Berkelbacteria bacterium RBG_13_40_8]
MRKIILASIFFLSAILMIVSARLDSVTTDEGVHLFAGYTYLNQSDFRLDPEHPPLLKELGALPLLFQKNVTISLDDLWDKAGNFYHDSWRETRALSDKFIAENSESIIFISRLVFILLTLGLGAFGYFWSKKLYGEKAGIFTAFLVLFFPNILAHGRLINTDLGLTLFIFITIYFWGKFLKQPIISNTILSGLFLGLVLASKFTGIIILPILLILVIIKLILQKSWKSWLKYLLGLITVGVIAYLIIWGTYGFSIQAPPKISQGLAAEINTWAPYETPDSFDKIFKKVRPILIPNYFYKGLAMVGIHAAGGHSSYLLGQTSGTGWWYYFPVAIFFKTPIPIFILLFLSVFYFKKIRAKDIFDEYLLIIPVVIFLAFAMYSKADLGIRHILPVFPFLFVFISKTINLINFKKLSYATIVFALLIAWYLISAIISFPNYIAYFNEFADGSKGGYKILTDSNLDWGQDVFRIKSYVEKNQITDYYLVYGWDGEQYLHKNELNYKTLLPDENVRGKIIISASSLVGEPGYSWLKEYPRTQITPGVFLITVS